MDNEERSIGFLSLQTEDKKPMEVKKMKSKIIIEFEESDETEEVKSEIEEIIKKHAYGKFSLKVIEIVEIFGVSMGILTPVAGVKGLLNLSCLLGI